MSKQTWYKECPIGSNERRLYDALSARTGAKNIPFGSALSVWMELMFQLRKAERILNVLEHPDDSEFIVEFAVDRRGPANDLEFVTVKKFVRKV